MTASPRAGEIQNIKDTAGIGPDMVCKLLVWISPSFCSTQLQLMSPGVLGDRHLLKLSLGPKSAKFCDNTSLMANRIKDIE